MLTPVNNNLAWKTAKEAMPWNRQNKMVMRGMMWTLHFALLESQGRRLGSSLRFQTYIRRVWLLMCPYMDQSIRESPFNSTCQCLITAQLLCWIFSHRAWQYSLPSVPSQTVTRLNMHKTCSSSSMQSPIYFRCFFS